MGDYTKIIYLNLANITLKNGDSVITDEDTINSTVNTTLQKLTSLERICLDGMTSLSQITFVKSTPKLYELKLFGTKVKTVQTDSNGDVTYGVDDEKNVSYSTDASGKKVYTISKEHYTGLELLNDYTKNIRILSVNCTGTDLGKINTAMNSVYKVAAASRFGYESYNFYTDNGDVLVSLKNCSGISGIWWKGYADMRDYTLDLSGMTSLTTFSCSGNNFCFNVIFPSSLTFFRDLQEPSVFADLSRVTGELRIDFSASTPALIKKELASLNDNINLTVRDTYASTSLSGYTDFSIFKEIYEARGNKKINLVEFTFIDYRNGERVHNKITSLNGIEYVSGLQILNLAGQFSKLLDIDKLETFKESLTKLYLKNSSITSCKVFKEMKNLTYLDLSNNCISDTSTYKEGEQTITFNNLEVLAGLHTSKGGNLTKLFLVGNTGIINFTPVSELTWTDKSGF